MLNNKEGVTASAVAAWRGATKRLTEVLAAPPKWLVERAEAGLKKPGRPKGSKRPIEDDLDKEYCTEIARLVNDGRLEYEAARIVSEKDDPCSRKSTIDRIYKKFKRNRLDYMERAKRK